MAKVRGMGMIGDLEYLKYKGVADKVLASLDEEVRRTCLNLKTGEWYSYEGIHIPFYRAVDKSVAKGDENFFIDMGIFDANYSSKWYLKLFFKFTTPMKMTKKFPTLWNLYFDHGKIEIVKLDKNSYTVRLVGFDIVHIFDLVVEGWARYALEKAGAKNLKIVETKCREKGDEYTEWEAKWE